MKLCKTKWKDTGGWKNCTWDQSVYLQFRKSITSWGPQKKIKSMASRTSEVILPFYSTSVRTPLENCFQVWVSRKRKTQICCNGSREGLQKWSKCRSPSAMSTGWVGLFVWKRKSSRETFYHLPYFNWAYEKRKRDFLPRLWWQVKRQQFKKK